MAAFIAHAYADFMSATLLYHTASKMSTFALFFQRLSDDGNRGADLPGQRFALNAHDLEMRLVDRQQ
jgi:hypothetical protein